MEQDASQNLTDSNDLTPADIAAMRRNQAQRIKAQFEKLLRVFEDIELPEDHAGVDKAAKALITLNKAMKEIYAPEKSAHEPSEPQQRDDEMNDDTQAAASLAEYRAKAIAEDPRCAQWADWQFKLERKLDALAEKRAAQGGLPRDDGEGLSAA